MSSRLIYIGNFVPPHSTENEVASCFRELGWDLTLVQESDLSGGARAEWARLEASVAHADLVLYTRTWGLPPDLAAQLWARCAQLGTPTAALHLDLFFGLDSPKGHLPRHQMPARDPMFRTAFVFTPDGDHADNWRRAGVNHHWLPPAIGCDSCWDGQPSERWQGIDVAFVGSRGYHPEWAHRPLLIEELERRFGDRFAHISGETLGGRALRGPELHDLYATIPVIVGDSCWVDCQPPLTRYWSDRVYEVWGRGGFLLMPYIEALDLSLKKSGYPCWDPWDDFDAMESSIRRWVEDPAGREVMRRAYVDRVRNEHTWSSRVLEMLAIIERSHA